MTTITVISGKGGTGKTFVSSNLALVASREQAVTLLDCDVEEPNAHLFLKPRHWTEEPVGQFRPVVADDLCRHCGKCAAACRFGAILSFKNATRVVSELCHGCGTCQLACPHGAIRESQIPVGVLRAGAVDANLDLAMGLLNVGRMSGVRLIRELKRQFLKKDRMAILDAPPGTSCPVVASLRSADFVLAVTEPTPMGLHDLRMAVSVVKQMNLPFGIVVNRAGVSYPELDAFIAGSGARTVFALPFERMVAETTASGLLVAEHSKQWKDLFCGLWDRVRAVCA